jgi:hypothetical protein
VRLLGTLSALGLVLLAVACARTVAPEGGPIPETPMGVIETSPEDLTVVDPFDGPVHFEFDRRVSERPTTGQLRDAVVVSPRTGDVEVRQRRRGLEIRMEGGFRDETIYRITLLPTVQDLWQNRLAGPFDLFFSTGPEFEPNVLGGLVADRLTGEDAAGVRVDAVPRTAGPTHSTVTDSAGIFTFPYLPADRYMIWAYEDQNRNREPDFMEPQDSLEVDLARGDTLIVTELALLLPDTTPAVVQRADVLDSVSVQLTFDDPLDPEMSLEGIEARLTREDGTVPGVAEILHLHEWEARRADEAPDPEDPPGDPDDPAAPPPQPPAEPEPDPAAEDPAAPQPDDPLLPGYELVLVLDGPLEPEATYTVIVEGVTNLNGVPGGGGEVEFDVPAAPEPEEDEPPDPDPPGDPPPDTIPPPDPPEAA